MKLARFVNYTDEIFAHPSLGGHDDLCQWAREPYRFPAKSSMAMEDWKARFFAKHLTNRELLKTTDGERHTSPKQDQEGNVDDPQFLAIFNKCYIPMDTPEQSEEKTKDALIQEQVSNALPDQVSSDLPRKEKKKFCEYCDSKGVVHKKECPTRQTKESSFEGLK